MKLRAALSAVGMAGLAALACSSSTNNATAAPQREPKAERQTVNRDAQLQSEFVKRVEQYVALRNKLESQTPAVPKDAEPEQMAAHQKALLDLLARARASAKAGDIFTPDARALFRRMLQSARQQPMGTQAKQAIQEENPGLVKIRVNGEYPTGLPLTTVPPQVLLALPRLPAEDVEYRFVGRRLLLIDSRARMVVDYMDNALP